MKKVIVWGSCAEFDKFYRWMEIEILKGNMEIEAVVLNEEHLINRLEGIEVIPVVDLMVREYDYLINLNQNDPALIAKILELLSIPSDKVIPIKVFGLPFFDFQRYLAVRESRVSIVASNCWGGYTYHSLGLPFLSPFINMFVMPEDYLKLLKRFAYYIDQPLHYIRDGYEEVLKRNYPIVGLEDVTLHFNHYTDFTAAVSIWERRKERLNFENLLIEMIIQTKAELEEFLALPFARKVGFSTIKCSEQNIVYFPVCENSYIQNKYHGNMLNFFNHMAMGQGTDELAYYDVLKLLNGEKEFMRADMLERQVVI